VPGVVFREATVGDIGAIAALHVRSWREHYRGVYSDGFLDGEAIADRLAVWDERLTQPEPRRFTTVADLDLGVVGFAHVILDNDPIRGAVLQNLHVQTTVQRRGIGSGLVSAAAQTLLDRCPESGLHVWVRERNAAAKAFYEAIGGMPVEHKLGGPFADGSRAPVLCLVWPRPAILVAST
jgi:ribosomal protein S18 acetylase RimI-like enzyme